MLQITKFEMHSGADRNTFGNAAYAVCKTAKSSPGVNDAKYYWVCLLYTSPSPRDA